MKSLLEPLLVLLLAWALGSVIVDLQLSAYVVSSLQGQLESAYLPTIVFVLSGLVALCTGSSWGTMASAPPKQTPEAQTAVELPFWHPPTHSRQDLPGGWEHL